MARLCQLLYLSEKIKIPISIKIVSRIKQGMSNMKRTLKPIALAASVLFTDSAFSNETKNAQQANVGVTIGLTGTNLEISKPLNNYVSVRGEMNINGKVDRKLTLENNRYDITFNPDIKSLFVDIHPFSSAFYLTGGLISQNINFELRGNPSISAFNFNGTSYAYANVTKFTGKAGFSNSTAPYLGLGWSNRNNVSSGVAFSFEAGLINVGTGSVDFGVECGSGLSSSQCSALQSDVAAEMSKVNSDLDRKLFYPVVKLGISYRF